MSRISKIRVLEHHTYSVRKLKMPVARMDDYDEYQPCFWSDDSEEFYSSLNTPTPGEDIWKKFELLPTPPRSPKREAYSEFSLDDADDISSILDDDTFLNPNNSAIPFPESPPQNPNLHSKLIQDCMWSGNNANKVIEATKLKSMTPIDGVPSPDCVDPTAVFPYPINETRYHSLGTETPSDSEDEEVDVVSTSDDKQISIGVQIKQEPCSPKSSPVKSKIHPARNIVDSRTNSITCVKVKIETQEYVPQSDCSAISVHNYSLPYQHGVKRTRSTPQQTQPVVSHKRCRRDHQTEPMLKSVARKLKSSVNVDLVSDCEENCEGKRTLHNVLERRRRNDLKDSFYVLRDHVPELDSKEKAPKVLILQKAAEYIHSLRRTDSRNTRELGSLKQKNEVLKRKLALLQQEVETDEEEYSID